MEFSFFEGSSTISLTQLVLRLGWCQDNCQLRCLFMWFGCQSAGSLKVVKFLTLCWSASSTSTPASEMKAALLYVTKPLSTICSILDWLRVRSPMIQEKGMKTITLERKVTRIQKRKAWERSYCSHSGQNSHPQLSASLMASCLPNTKLHPKIVPAKMSPVRASSQQADLQLR